MGKEHKQHKKHKKHKEHKCPNYSDLGLYVRENENVYGVKKYPNTPNDAETINETLYPQLQSQKNIENPLFQFRDLFVAYKMLSIYNYFEPLQNQGPFYKYLKDISVNTSYFTRKESLSALNIALQQMVNFLSKTETKNDISNIHKNVKLLIDYLGVESEVFKIGLKLQQLNQLYSGLTYSDDDMSSQYKDGILQYDTPNNFLSSQTAVERLRKISLLMDEKIISVNNVNNIPIETLFSSIEQKVPKIAPLSNNIKHEINKLKQRGVNSKKLNELMDYITTNDFMN